MKKSQYAILFLVFCFISAGIWAAPIVEEGIFFDGVEGLLKKRANIDVWDFTPSEPIKITEQRAFPANQSIQMLPCSVLEQMTELAGEENEIRVELSAFFTNHEHKNFLYSVFFLPLQVDKPALKEPQQPDKQSDEPTAPAKEDSILPTEILQQIKETKVADLKRFQSISKVTGDINLIGRTGYLTQKDGVIRFESDTLGMKLDDKQYLLLPNSTLAIAHFHEAHIPGKQRYNISGLVTEYKGKKYILLRRATRTFSHGNFRD